MFPGMEYVQAAILVLAVVMISRLPEWTRKRIRNNLVFIKSRNSCIRK